MRQPRGYDGGACRFVWCNVGVDDGMWDAGATSDFEAAVIRRKRPSRYWTYSDCSSSQRSFDRVRNPARRASSSSGHDGSPAAVGIGDGGGDGLVSGGEGSWKGKRVRRREGMDRSENVTRAKPLHFGEASGGSCWCGGNKIFWMEWGWSSFEMRACSKLDTPTMERNETGMFSFGEKESTWNVVGDGKRLRYRWFSRPSIPE
jgi:hypothetical protein